MARRSSVGPNCCAPVSPSAWPRARSSSRWPIGCTWRTSPAGGGHCLSGETWRELATCRREVRAMKYELALDLQGAIRSALAARASGAKVRIGPSQPREGPARMFYTRRSMLRARTSVEQALSLASAVAGRELEYVEPPFPLDPAADAWAENLIAKLDGKPLAILNPGAGWGAKCWPAESFGVVARALAERGLAVVVNHGPGEEELAEAVVESSGGVALAAEVLGRRIDRAHPPRQPLHRRGHRPHAPGGGVARSRGRVVRSDAPGAQRPFRHAQRGVAQPGKRGQHESHRSSR